MNYETEMARATTEPEPKGDEEFFDRIDGIYRILIKGTTPSPVPHPWLKVVF
jgi:hypothetical protein